MNSIIPLSFVLKTVTKCYPFLPRVTEVWVKISNALTAVTELSNMERRGSTNYATGANRKPAVKHFYYLIPTKLACSVPMSLS